MTKRTTDVGNRDIRSLEEKRIVGSNGYTGGTGKIRSVLTSQESRDSWDRMFSRRSACCGAAITLDKPREEGGVDHCWTCGKPCTEKGQCDEECHLCDPDSVEPVPCPFENGDKESGHE